jgi:hypothetical protein
MFTKKAFVFSFSCYLAIRILKGPQIEGLWGCVFLATIAKMDFFGLLFYCFLGSYKWLATLQKFLESIERKGDHNEELSPLPCVLMFFVFHIFQFMAL